MPTTARRRKFVPLAIRYFLRQDYANRELVIVDDGPESLADIIPDDPQIRYVRLNGRRTLGVKRNLCVKEARGDLIMHWDDDDWFSSRRITYQVNELLSAGAEICGLRQMIFYELATGRSFLYQYPPGQRAWLAGGSLLYTKEFWRRSPFPDVQVASDTRFVWGQRMDRSVTLREFDFYVALIHPENTSAKNHHGAYWSAWPGSVENVMGEDFDLYRNGVQATNPGREEAQPERPTRSIPSIGLTGKTTMRIGYVVTNFSPLSESFIRREVLALCDAGHRVFVYTCHRARDARSPEPQHRNLTVREPSFLVSPARLIRAAADDEVEHLHATLMSAAHRAAFTAARSLQIPFTLTAYSGHDIFTRREPSLYREASRDALCVGIIVEDDFMRDWMTQQLGVLPEKIRIVPNSLDLDQYRLPKRRENRTRVVILTLARFVEKKGLIYLIQAFHQLAGKVEDVELWLIGYGPEEWRLRQAAGNNPQIKFLGPQSEAETRAAYAEADIFCLPCIRTSSGDADGVPTTVLEAMAFELPVVASNLLSMPCYVRDDEDGLLAAPGDVAALAAALERLCGDEKLRRKLGQSARQRVAELCDIKHNAKLIENILSAGRAATWREKLGRLEQQRHTYTAEREAYYAEMRNRAVEYFQPRPGKLLDIGCGDGQLRLHLPKGVDYFGCDALAHEKLGKEFLFTKAAAERLPYADETFDSVVFYAVLIHVLNVDQSLSEAARVLKPGGRLYLQECYNDPNPIHMNHFTAASLREQVAKHFTVIDARPANDYLMLTIAQKPSASVALANTIEAEPPGRKPLASICITTYNRASLVHQCIESVLRQTFRTEVIVVDDCSTDQTRRVLESFGSAIRVFYNETNKGIAFSKNRALTMSSPEARYVGILDSDDYLHSSFVEHCVEYLENNPQVGLVYTDDILVDPAGRELNRQRAVEPWNTESWLRTRNLRGDTWLARRDLVMRTKLHDLRLELDVDYDLFYQLLKITTFAHLPEFLVYIRQHDGRMTINNQLALARAHAANLVKHGYSPEYAYLRARFHPEWIPAVEDGIALGHRLREQQRANG
jgi:glycosyltransferase involved in cell wall biosynthesis/ubiquinone/menaquinone biosynthesis C-methylase UbiE